MLARFTIDLSGQPNELADILHETGGVCDPVVRPGGTAPALLLEGGRIRTRAMTWGVPGTGGSVVGGERVEALRTRPGLRDSVQNRRCAVPASHLPGRDDAGDAPVYLAACYNLEGSRFVVLHRHGAPVTLGAGEVAGWLEDGARRGALPLS